jgi:26S proteasome regulatory subunit N13
MSYDSSTHKCEADRRKGLIVVKKSPEGYYTFEFKDASTGQVIEGPDMIFEGDVTFAKVKQSEDRTYVMTFKEGKRRRFYWFQVSENSWLM